MKVLHIISGDLWAGAEVQAFNLLTALSKQAGIEVAVALMNDGELARKLNAYGIPIFVIPESELNGIAVLWRLRKLMHQWAPDVIHTHRTKENILGCLANLVSKRVASVRTVHGAPEYGSGGNAPLRRRLMNKLDNWCGKTLQDRVISVSTELAQKLRQNYSSEHISVVENGIDLAAVQAAIHPVDFRNQEPSALHIGVVGRLAAVKRHDLFLEAAALLAKRRPERPWRFHIFGAGPLHQQLCLQADKLGITDRLTLHGHRSDIVACVANLDVLVICSDHEGLPMTVLEATAVATPIVAHAVGGIVDVLATDSRSLLTHDHTARGYASAIEEALARSAKSSQHE